MDATSPTQNVVLQERVAPVIPPIPEVNVFDNQTWLRILCSQVGVPIEQVPSEVLAAIKLKRSKPAVNEVFFGWYTNRPPIPDVVLSPEDTHLMANTLGVRYSREYQNVEASLKDAQAIALRRFREAQEYLSNMAHHRARLMQITQSTSKDLTGDIKQIMAEGWWTYDSRLTHLHNHTNSSAPGLIFLTPRVNMKYFNKEAGIDMNIDMGRYKCLIVPMHNEIRFVEFEDNLDADGCFHPHVLNGQMCWGNAASIVTQGLDRLEFIPILNAARTILENYNDESPYRDASAFEILRNPALLEGRAVTYAFMNDAVTVNADYIDVARSTIIREYDDDVVKIRLYRKVYEGTTHRIGSELYYKDSDGDYQAYIDDEEYHNEWS